MTAPGWTTASAGMMGRFRDAGQAVLWMSHGINLGHAVAYGNPLKDVVRLYWSPRAHLGAADIWREIRDDQLRGWYDAGWRKVPFLQRTAVAGGRVWRCMEIGRRIRSTDRANCRLGACRIS